MTDAPQITSKITYDSDDRRGTLWGFYVITPTRSIHCANALPDRETALALGRKWKALLMSEQACEHPDYIAAKSELTRETHNASALLSALSPQTAVA